MILGCYGYRSISGVTVIHVFINDAVRCACRARGLRH